MAPTGTARKLTTIVAADVAGYSRLMGADEEGTLAALKAHRRELIDAKIADHHGRLIKTTGDGVNVAARLEAMALTGGIFLSRATRDQVRDRLDLAFDDLGEHELKNIARPVRVFRVQSSRAAGQPNARPAAVAPTPPPQPAIAVLSFANMSGDAEQEYFADGISEDIIMAL